MDGERRIIIPYAPRQAFKPFHSRTQRFAVGVAHRRAGKTVATINDKIKRAILSDKERYRAAYIAPYLKQAKDVAWEYLKHYSKPIQAKPPNESELYVELLNGARIRIYGADNAESLRGGYLDDATLDEYADMAPSVWPTIIRPMLADRLGSANFIGTPKGKNAFYEIYRAAEDDPAWFRFMLKASETGLIVSEELEAARRDMTAEQYEQEFECSFDAAIVGAYYGKELAELERLKRITEFEVEPALPVHTAWDLGIGDSTAIWFWQVLGNEVRIIDHYEASGYGLDHYAKVIFAKPYKRGSDWVPHDARVRELGTGRSRVETMQALSLKPELVPAHKIEDGINAARLMLPLAWFKASTCNTGVEALKQYRTEFDEKTRAFRNTPKHDWTSHTADAFRYLAMAWREQAKPDMTPKPEPKHIGNMTLDELWKTKAPESEFI